MSPFNTFFGGEPPPPPPEATSKTSSDEGNSSNINHNTEDDDSSFSSAKEEKVEEKEEKNMLKQMKKVSSLSSSPSISMDLPGNAAIREFMDKLTCTTNVSKYIELPMIAVMGDTSSGKSSLLSQLANIELPQSHELTTRCPVLLQMIRQSDNDGVVDDDDDKSATKDHHRRGASVQIQWRDTANTKENGNDNDDGGFPEQFVQESNLQQLPLLIQKAQNHIMEKCQKDISHNIVSVKIYGGPDCYDLTLMDLPGLVRSHSRHESEDMISNIQSLIQEYLQNQRCVILAVVPANVDFHNSQIMSDAQKVDPQTSRTIPVITKPDLIDMGAESDVLELLMGDKINFSLGFHMVKGRGQAALDKGQSIQDGLIDETQFFERVEPWKSVQERDLFGTTNLRRKLGELQMSMIRDSIPSILKEITQKQQEAMNTLSTMGEPTLGTILDKRRCYQDICQSFLSNLKASLSGKGSRAPSSSSIRNITRANMNSNSNANNNNEPSAAAKLHEACTLFMASIRDGSLATIKSIVEGAQVLVTSEKGSVHGDVVHVGNGYACVDFVNKKDQTTDVLFDFVGYHSDSALEEDNVWSDGTKVYIARSDNTFDLLKNIPLDKIRTDPSWLQDKIADNRTDDLACFLNADIFKNIVSEFIEEDWTPHCTALVNKTSAIVQLAITESLSKTSISVSGRYPKLKQRIQMSSFEAAQTLVTEAQKQVRAHLDIEKHPYTQDHILFEHIAAARHRSIKRDLEAALRLDHAGAFDTEAIRTIMDEVFERNRLKTVDQHMAEDMEIVLESYGRIATKRVIDRTPMICWEVFRTLETRVQDSLWNTTDEELDIAMRDSPSFIRKYKELTEELEEMNKAMVIFQSLV